MPKHDKKSSSLPWGWRRSFWASFEKNQKGKITAFSCQMNWNYFIWFDLLLHLFMNFPMNCVWIVLFQTINLVNYVTAAALSPFLFVYLFQMWNKVMTLCIHKNWEYKTLWKYRCRFWNQCKMEKIFLKIHLTTCGYYWSWSESYVKKNLIHCWSHSW